MKKFAILIVLGLVACSGEKPADESTVRGVTDTSVTFGIHTDMSGVLATWGVPNVNGIRMRFEEENAKGGVHSRMLELVAEDSQYQVPLAVKATNKLINVDEIFAMIGAMGTPHNNAVFTTMFDAGVPSIFPATAAVSMAEPLHPMKFSWFLSYRDQASMAIRYLVGQYDIDSVCLQRLATDYGEEVELGFHRAVDDLGLTVGYAGGHKMSETDFTGTATSIKNAGCELLVLGPFIKDTIQIYTAVRAAGWDGPVLGNMVSYVPEIAAANDGAMEGLYSAAPFFVPDFESEFPDGSWAGAWADRYQERFGTAPVGQSVITYQIADFTIRALHNAGRELTLDSFLAGMEAINEYEDPFGGPSMSLSPTKHVAANAMNLYQVKDGKWTTVAEGISE